MLSVSVSSNLKTTGNTRQIVRDAILDGTGIITRRLRFKSFDEFLLHKLRTWLIRSGLRSVITNDGSPGIKCH